MVYKLETPVSWDNYVRKPLLSPYWNACWHHVSARLPTDQSRVKPSYMGGYIRITGVYKLSPSVVLVIYLLE